MEKSPEAFRTISEVAAWLDTPAHVLRFWESRFSQVKPVKRAGGRRYYRPGDMLLLGGIKKLLHEDGLTIRGVQKILREEGVRFVAELSPPLDDGSLIDLKAEGATAGASNGAGPAEGTETAPPAAARRAPPAPEPDEAILPGLDLGPTPAEPTEERQTEEAPTAAAEAAEPQVSEIAPETVLADETLADASQASADVSSQALPQIEPEPESSPRPPQSPEADLAEEPTPEAPLAFRHSRQATESAEPPQEALPSDPQPDAEAEPPSPLDTEPPQSAEPARREPLGADLPAVDPADDDPALAPPGPPLRATLRDPAIRRMLAADPARLGATVERLRALATRLDQERPDDRK